MKPKLKTNTKTTIPLQDWNAFIKEIYGKPYSFQQQEGCRDKGIYTIYIPETLPKENEDYGYDYDPSTPEKELCGVPLTVWLSRDPKQPLEGQKYDFELEIWWFRQFYPYIEELEEDLARKGLLDPGEYTIIIDW